MPTYLLMLLTFAVILLILISWLIFWQLLVCVSADAELGPFSQGPSIPMVDERLMISRLERRKSGQRTRTLQSEGVARDDEDPEIVNMLTNDY